MQSVSGEKALALMPQAHRDDSSSSGEEVDDDDLGDFID